MVGEGGNAGLAPSTMAKAHFFQEGAKIYIPVLCGRTQLPPPASQPGPRPPGTEQLPSLGTDSLTAGSTRCLLPFRYSAMFSE